VYAKVSDYTGEYCDSSNGQLALFFGVSERSISKAVNTLISSGYIALKGFDGRKRLLTRTNNFLSRN
jgi:Mn-dependent DtxR family transcriptional regulator